MTKEEFLEGKIQLSEHLIISEEKYRMLIDCASKISDAYMNISIACIDEEYSDEEKKIAESNLLCNVLREGAIKTINNMAKTIPGLAMDEDSFAALTNQVNSKIIEMFIDDK